MAEAMHANEQSADGLFNRETALNSGRPGREQLSRMKHRALPRIDEGVKITEVDHDAAQRRLGASAITRTQCRQVHCW